MICSKCAKFFDVGLPKSVNVASRPELKEKILDGTFFLVTCPYCGQVNLYSEDFVYNDPTQHILIVLSRVSMSSPGLEGYTCRQVETVGDLIEKIKIFDAGLDDVAMEICKFVTLQEMSKDVQLKFYKMEGSDAQIVFAYPEKGEMHLIEIGQNVYADAMGILSRNPEIVETARGLVKVDQGWLRKFFG